MSPTGHIEGHGPHCICGSCARFSDLMGAIEGEDRRPLETPAGACRNCGDACTRQNWMDDRHLCGACFEGMENALGCSTYPEPGIWWYQCQSAPSEACRCPDIPWPSEQISDELRAAGLRFRMQEKELKALDFGPFVWVRTFYKLRPHRHILSLPSQGDFGLPPLEEVT